MIDLVAKSPAAGLLPVTVGASTLSEQPVTQIYSRAPFKGAHVSTALKKAVGLGLPNVGGSKSEDGVEILWAARGQYFLIGAKPPPLPAAITDQSDAWCTVALTGENTDHVMARLCPLDIASMEHGDVARSLVGHMSAIIVKRMGGVTLMVFRAFAKTLVHDLQTAMRSVTAQATLPD